MNRGIYRKPGESGAEPYLSSQFMGLFGWRAFIAGGDPISIGFRPVPLWRSRAKEHPMTAKTSFRGSFPALVTPFKNGVTSAVNNPRKLVLAVMVFSLARLLHRGTGRNPWKPGAGHGVKPSRQ